MNKTILSTGIALGTLAIILGAFGAHGLKNSLDPDALQGFETGVRYQMYHALLLLFLGLFKDLAERQRMAIFVLILLGTVFFSFSIYLLATNDLTNFDFKRIAFITPIGGILLILGWLTLGYRVFRQFS